MTLITIEIISGFLTGVILTPIAIEIYSQYIQDKINYEFDEKRNKTINIYGKRILELKKQINEEIDKYNTKLKKTKKKLAKHNIFIEIDENNNEILIRKTIIKHHNRIWQRNRR